MLRRIATLAAVAVLASACGGDEPEEDAEPEMAAFQVELVTTSGSVAANHDDEHCAWTGTEYTLRDGEGSILDTGHARSTIEGEAKVGDEPAEIGEVLSMEPYECVMRFDIEAEEAEFYELEVSTQEPRFGDREFTETVEFSRKDARTGVEVEFSG